MAIAFLLSCQPPIKTDQTTITKWTSRDYSIPYAMDKPSSSYNLPNALNEISGLSYSTISQSLIAINDEQGIVFYLNKEDGAITDIIDYGRSGDYEGISYHDGMLYTAKSNGDISVISESNGVLQELHEGILSREQDIEGLCYSPSQDLILLTAKGKSSSKKKDQGLKAIFKMDYRSGNIDDNPFLLIDLETSSKALIHANMDKTLSKRIKKFAPSGIAEHPISQDYYILSAKGSLLVIIDQEKELKAIILLDQNQHRQAEGICFDSETNLYISNEAKSGNSAVLYKYNYKSL